MKYLKLFLVLTTSVFLASCASSGIKGKNGVFVDPHASDMTMTLKNTTVAETIKRMGENCRRKGLNAKIVDSNTLVCSFDLQGEEAFMAETALGGGSNMPPKQNMHFSINQVGNDVGVVIIQTVSNYRGSKKLDRPINLKAQ